MHRDGDWHGAIHIWVGGLDEEGRPFALLQRRSLTKDTWPGSLDVAVGGHFRAGETLLEALREAEEEIGLPIGTEDVTRLGRRFAQSDSGRDNEVQDVFAVRSDRALDAYRLHPEEVDSVVSVPLDGILALFQGRRTAVQAAELRRGGIDPTVVQITVSGFAAGSGDGYPALALQGLLDVVTGGAPEPFELRSRRQRP